MEDVIVNVLLTFGVALILLVLGGVIGAVVESAHFRRLDARERGFADILVSDMRKLPPGWQASDAVLVNGEAVIATDYFKVVAAGLRNLFGGRVRSYEPLMDRARREAICRMLGQARRAGANVVWNVRIGTSTIQGKDKGKSGGVEVLAYGTAMKVVGM